MSTRLESPEIDYKRKCASILHHMQQSGSGPGYNKSSTQSNGQRNDPTSKYQTQTRSIIPTPRLLPSQRPHRRRQRPHASTHPRDSPHTREIFTSSENTATSSMQMYTDSPTLLKTQHTRWRTRKDSIMKHIDAAPSARKRTKLATGNICTSPAR
jgi:hypothetical protein